MKSDENALSIMTEALTTVNAGSSIDVKILEEDTRDKLMEILDEIEAGTTLIREKIDRIRYDEMRAKVTFHESHNGVAPAECGFLWKNVKVGEDEIVMWHRWEDVPRVQKCRMCRIGNREIKGTQKERDQLKKNVDKARKVMGWD